MIEEKVERRTKADIFFDILRIIQNEKKAKTTRILYGANLSYARLKKNIDYLIQNGFIQKTQTNGSTYFILTERGFQFINEFRKVKRFSEAFGISI